MCLSVSACACLCVRVPVCVPVCVPLCVRMGERSHLEEELIEFLGKRQQDHRIHKVKRRNECFGTLRKQVIKSLHRSAHHVHWQTQLLYTIATDSVHVCV
jgi:hypothetical protein